MYRSELTCSLFGCLLLLALTESACGQVAVYPDEPKPAQLAKNSATQVSASFTRPAGFTEYISSVLQQEQPAEKCGDSETAIVAAEVACTPSPGGHKECPVCRRAVADRVTVADMKESVADRILITLKQVPRHFGRDNTFQGTRSWCRDRFSNGVALMPGQILSAPAKSCLCAECVTAAGCAEIGSVPEVPAQDKPSDSSSLPLWHQHRKDQDTARDDVPLPLEGNPAEAVEEAVQEPVATETAPGAPGSDYVEPPAWNGRRSAAGSPDAES